jgi:gluconate:H+ symporter, GntP family
VRGALLGHDSPSSDDGLDAPSSVSAGALALAPTQVNDAGFWLVNQYFGMSVPDTLKSWSVMEMIVSTVGLGCVMLLSLIV